MLNNQACGSASNIQTEGHGGYLVTYLTTDSPPQGGKGKLSELKTWAAEKPEVVLMEYDTNDAWSSIATSSIISAYGFVVDKFRAQNPKVIFFVAQITPLNPSGCASCEANMEALNAAIPAWASGKSTTTSSITVVHIWSSLPAASYTPQLHLHQRRLPPQSRRVAKDGQQVVRGVDCQGAPVRRIAVWKLLESPHATTDPCFLRCGPGSVAWPVPVGLLRW